MSKETPAPAPPSRPLSDGFTPVSKGHQPMAARPAGTSTAQGGYQPTTSQGGSGAGTPPSQGSGGKK